MANLEIRFQAPLTRPGIKLEKITRVVGGREKKSHLALKYVLKMLYRTEELLTVQQ